MMNFETSKRPRWDRSCVWPNLKGWLVLFQTFLELLLVILLSFNFFYYNISFRAAPLIQWKSHLDKACYIPITPSSHLYSPPHTLSLSSHCSFLATANIPTWLNLGKPRPNPKFWLTKNPDNTLNTSPYRFWPTFEIFNGQKTSGADRGDRGADRRA